MKIFFTFMSFITFCSCNAVKNSFSFFPDRRIPQVKIPSYVQEKWIKTGDGLKIHSFLFSKNMKGKKRNLIVYFHGNAGNAYHRIADASRLYEMDCDVLLIDYRGYGRSEGSPTESGVYRDGASSVRYAVEKLKYSPESIFLFGRSIGTTVAVHLGQNKKYAGVVLVSPLTSAREFVKSKSMSLFSPVVGDSFNSIGKINNLKSPVLFIHGTDDNVINYALGFRLYESFRGKKKFIRIEGGDHNHLQTKFSRQYWGAIREFLKKHSS